MRTGKTIEPLNTIHALEDFQKGRETNTFKLFNVVATADQIRAQELVLRRVNALEQLVLAHIIVLARINDHVHMVR